MPFTRLPVAEASIAFDFPISAVAIVASLVLLGIIIMGLLDYRKTRAKRLEAEGDVDSPPS